MNLSFSHQELSTMSIRWPIRASVRHRSRRSGRPLFFAAALIAMTCAGPSARAGWFIFNVGGIHPGQAATVAEQIFPTVVGGNVYLDYEFLVKNTGRIPINGFALGLGAVPAVLPAPVYASVNGGGDGPYPNAIAGGFPGGAPPIVNFWDTTKPWGFEEFQDGWPALPATYYVVRWYAANQLNPLLSMPVGAVARFDLLTTYPPAGGGGAVDPFSGGFLGIDDNGTYTDTNFTGSVTVSSSSSPPPSGFSVPEPGSMISGGTAVVVLSFLGWLRRRRRHSVRR
jgi:hypothetical protein